jgi:enoyl-CoA hydratase/carnithine racemase
VGHIEYSVSDHVATIVLNNLEQRNAVDKQMSEQLLEAYEDVITNDEVRVLVISGAGEKAFCSGASITGYIADGVLGDDAEKQRTPLPKPWRISKPVIAAIEGYAVGGGMALALYCDIRVMTTSAKVGATALKRGVVNGSTQATRLTRLIGLGNALELVLTSKVIDGAEAYRIGLAQRLVEPGHALEEALKMAKVIAAYSPDAVQGTKRIAYDNLDLSMDEALTWELAVSERSFRTPDAKEGFVSFAEKRDAVWGDGSALEEMGFDEYWPEGDAPQWRK